MALFRWAAPIYDATMNLVGHGNTLQELVEIMEPEPSKRLLDLGGGTGQLLDYLPGNMKVTLVDSSEEMLTQARKKARTQKVKYINARGDDLPITGDTFDYAVVADALHHFSRVSETIEELRRVLKTEGEIYILEFDPESLLTKFISTGESIVGEPANFFSPQELSQMVSEAGFTTCQDNISTSVYIIKGKVSEK